MGAEEKKKNEILSQIVADLSVKSKGNEDLSSKIRRLRDELKKVVENEDTILGKFRGLVESFREIIPEEKQRYHAAIKALSATSKLSRQDIVKGFSNQLEELKILQKGLMSALPGGGEGLKAMEAKLRETRDEISSLREKIGRLENEEKEILNGMASREKEIEHVEKAVGELFADIGTEITSVKKKVEEFSVESASSQPIWPRDSIKIDITSNEKGGGEQISEAPSEEPEYSAPQDSEWQKKCPMCGGRMNFHINEQLWMCYSCAYEESEKGEVQGKSEEKNKHMNASRPFPASNPIIEFEESKKESSPFNNQPSSKKKTCPVCRKKMSWHQTEKAWRCPYCQYERRI